MIVPIDVSASILAGGRSSRMGRDKALLLYNGRPFISHIAETLSTVFQHVNVIADRAEAYAFVRCPILADKFPNSGPLAGIHSALSNSTRSHVFITSCDTPFISADVVMTLLNKAQPAEITISDDGSNTLPLVGVYPTSILENLELKLSSSEKRVKDFLETCIVRVSVVAMPEYRHNLRNINTPEEYTELVRL